MVTRHFHFNGFFPNMLYFFIFSDFFSVGSAWLPQHLLYPTPLPAPFCVLEQFKTPAAKFGNHKIDRPILFKAG